MKPEKGAGEVIFFLELTGILLKLSSVCAFDYLLDPPDQTQSGVESPTPNKLSTAESIGRGSHV